MNNTRLADISCHITSGSRGWASYYSDDGALFLRMTNLPKDGIKLILEDNKFVKLPKEMSEARRTAVQEGDILISITAELGKIGFVENIPRDKAYVNQHVCLVRPIDQKVNPKFLAYYLSSHTQKRLFNRLNDAGAKSGLNLQTISRFPINLPERQLQDFVVEALQEWDTVIEKTEKLLDAKRRQFIWLVSSLINKSSHAKKQLSYFVKEVLERNQESKISRVLSVTNHRGFMRAKDRFNRRIASKDVTQYKIIRQGQYAYNPSRINVGSIARLDNWNNGILSPIYTVFELNEEEISSDYFMHWLSSNESKQKLNKKSQGSVRETVSFGNLGTIKIRLPALNIQKNISKDLNIAKQEIFLLEKIIGKYRVQKHILIKEILNKERYKINQE